MENFKAVRLRLIGSVEGVVVFVPLNLLSSMGGTRGTISEHVHQELLKCAGVCSYPSLTFPPCSSVFPSCLISHFPFLPFLPFLPALQYFLPALRPSVFPPT
jgi:hypothetical protein